MADDERVIDGVFWTPGEGKRSYGTLAIERRRLTLTLMDSTRMPRLNGLGVMHGESLDGKPLTLLDAFTIQRSDWHGAAEHNRERLRVGTILIGTQVMAPEQLVFAKGVIRLRGLREWMSQPVPTPDGRLIGSSPRRLFERPHPQPPPRGRWARLRRRWRDWRPGATAADPERDHRLVVSVDEATVTFGFTKVAGGTEFHDSTDYEAEIMIELAQASPLPEWSERWLRPLQDLLVFAMREQCVIESFVAVIEDPALAEAVHPAIRVAAPDSAWSRYEVEIVRPDAVDLRERGIEPFRHMLLPLTAIRGRFDEVLPRWFDLHRRLGGAAAFFFGTLNVGRIYQENRLLNLLAFAEGYHRAFFDVPPFPAAVHEVLVERMLATLDDGRQREHYRPRLRYANSQSQRRRLRELIERAAEIIPELRPQTTTLREELVDTRNQYTHFGEPGPHVLAAADLFARVDRLQLVLEVNLMRALGVDDMLIPQLVAHAYQRRIP
jgi:hypothetical protein